MKKLLLVCVLAAACLGLLAAPAFAQPVLQDGVYVWIYDGSWFQVTDGQWGDNVPSGTQIPTGQDVWLVSMWAAYGRGHVQSIGNVLVETLSIDDQPVVSSKAASKALWSVPYPSEALNADSVWPFNPRMRIGGWVAVWLFPVTLGSGTHEVTGTETQTHPFTDLGFPAERGHGPLFFPSPELGVPWGPFGPWELLLP